MNSCNFSSVCPTFEHFSGHGRLLSQSEWRQALEEEEEEQKVRVGGRILRPNGGEGAQQYDQKLPCPLPKILQPFMTQSPCDPPTA